MRDRAPNLTQATGRMPIVFLVVMGLAMLAYVIIDGYDLGVDVLMRCASDEDNDIMIASIGPYWDANETWLVLGFGISLTVFPRAQGVILGALYLPVAMYCRHIHRHTAGKRTHFRKMVFFFQHRPAAADSCGRRARSYGDDPGRCGCGLAGDHRQNRILHRVFWGNSTALKY